MTNSTRIIEFVTDTMALVLRIERRKLGPTVKSIFDSVESENATVYVPAMVLAEILYLSEKQKINISLRDVADYFNRYLNYKSFLDHFYVSIHILNRRQSIWRK